MFTSVFFEDRGRTSMGNLFSGNGALGTVERYVALSIGGFDNEGGILYRRLLEYGEIGSCDILVVQQRERWFRRGCPD